MTKPVFISFTQNILQSLISWSSILIVVACSNRPIDYQLTNKTDSGIHQNKIHNNSLALDTIKAYQQAIIEYIRAINKTDIPNYDTLYIGNPDLLPKIELPDILLGKRVLLFSEDIAKKHPEVNRSFILINIAWSDFSQDPIEFMFFTFYNDKKQNLPFGFNPQHKSYIYLKYQQDSNKFILDRQVRFEFSNSK